MTQPEGWRTLVLNDLLTSTEYGTSAATSAEGTRPVVGMRNLRDGHITLDGLSHVDEELQDWSTLELKAGDLLLNRTNSPELVGRVGIVSEHTNAVFASYLVRLNADTDVVDPYFLNYFLNGAQAQRVIKSLATRGVSQANINPTVLRQHCPVLLPPLREQRKIAKIIRTWDDAIERLTALQGSALQERSWLGQNMLTGVVRLLDNQAWSLVALGKVLSEHSRLSTGNEQVFSVSVHKGLINQIEHLGRSFAATSTSHYNRVTKGDIVYTKSPTGNFPLGIIKQSTVKADVLVSPLYGVFSPSTFELGAILAAYFESPSLVQRYLHPLVQKGAKNTISITNQGFLEGKLSLPLDREEQKTIAAVLSDSELQIRAIAQERSKLVAQKRGLMQKLLTGEIRVTGDNIEDLEAASNG